MLDPALRGWMLLLAGAGMCVYAGFRHRARGGDFHGAEPWGERLIGIMLMIQGGVTHLEAAGGADLSWLYWLGFAVGLGGVMLVWAGRSRRPVTR
jgi:hypothetical protein